MRTYSINLHHGLEFVGYATMAPDVKTALSMARDTFKDIWAVEASDFTHDQIKVGEMMMTGQEQGDAMKRIGLAMEKAIEIEGRIDVAFNMLREDIRQLKEGRT